MKFKDFFQKEPKQLTEAKDIHDLVDRWMDMEQVHSFEGEGGIRNFEKFLRVLGYDNLQEFLADNSGAIEEIIEWICNQKIPEWTERLENEVPPDEDTE